ncbi:ROK family protein [Synechococcales cyanobacterium C]|uniref:ROK family protein n=1 Tax=Petrachloros mirabilis ULC683 TaxID=2781853 RepID=A0A8K2A1Z2_9CYAN|nr:ROK family protein [Petrachloros mirabilis]NCJ08356.1 ROK family protein [Petrachloros mirabilis ULC683]
MTETSSTLTTLAVDIGGSGVKVLLLDAAGQAIGDRTRIDTPQPATPTAIMAAILELAAGQGNFDRVSVGFPGVVRQGITKTAVNLDPSWIGFPLTDTLKHKLGKPVRTVNDADMQGLGAIAGQGVELVITLGTGFGSGLFLEGRLVPNLELGHHPFRKGQTYEEQLGRAAFDVIGKDKWNKRLQLAIATLDPLFNYDMLYLGGGNTKKIAFELPPQTQIVPNISGLLGGIALWQD